MRELLTVLDPWLAAYGRVALATVTRTWGSAPRPAGSHMAVNPRGEFAGSVSGGCVEGAVVRAALDGFASEMPGLLEFGIPDEMAWDVGLACGGRLEVYLESLARDAVHEALRTSVLSDTPVTLCTVIGGPAQGERVLARRGEIVAGAPVSVVLPLGAIHEAERADSPVIIEAGPNRVFVQSFAPAPRLIVVGAVHTAIPLVRLARVMGYRVTVVDARAAFATRERFPDADELLVEWPDTALDRLRPGPNAAVVVLTHDEKFDEPALLAALRSGAGYIGAIGSRSTSEDRALRLRGHGATARDLERIHSPVGLDIGSVTPEEIALSILAEIVAVRRGGVCRPARAAAWRAS